MKTEQVKKAITLANKAVAELSELRIHRANRQIAYDKDMRSLDNEISMKLTQISAAVSIAYGAITEPQQGQAE